jgi:hypothetical protein
MLVKLFVLGLPGSGKSTAARHIVTLAHNNRFAPKRFNDYEILYQWSLDEANGERFRTSPDGYQGFDVLDPGVYNDALRDLEKSVLQSEEQTSEDQGLIIVEFSRDDYYKALKTYFPAYLSAAFFLFIKADFPTCIQRIKRRANNPQTRDDHYVSERFFESRSNKQIDQSLHSAISKLEEHFNVSGNRCKVINNPGTHSKQSFLNEVGDFANSIFSQSVAGIERVPSISKYNIH